MEVNYLPRIRPLLGGSPAIIQWASEEFAKIQLAFQLYRESIRPMGYGLDILDGDKNDSAALVFRNSEFDDMAAIVANTNTDTLKIQNRTVSGTLELEVTDSGDNTKTYLSIDPAIGVDLESLDDFKIRKRGNGAIQRFTFDFPDATTDVCLFDIGLNTNTSGNVFFRLYDGQNSAWEIRAQSGNGTQFGSPTGGFKGAGTINAKAVYDDNTLLTDYVFDAELDGEVDRNKWTHARANKFADRLDDLDPRTFSDKWKQARKLPAFMDGDEQKSVGDIAQRLLETCEVQAVHINKLLERIEKLEQAR